MVRVNGTSYSGNNVTVENGRIRVDGKDVTPEKDREIIIHIDGDYHGKLKVEACNQIIISGSVTNGVEVTAGTLKIGGSVSGDAKTVSGNITCGRVGGDVKTTSGNINYTRSGTPPSEPNMWVNKEEIPSPPKPPKDRFIREARNPDSDPSPKGSLFICFLWGLLGSVFIYFAATHYDTTHSAFIQILSRIFFLQGLSFIFAPPRNDTKMWIENWENGNSLWSWLIKRDAPFVYRFLHSIIDGLIMYALFVIWP